MPNRAVIAYADGADSATIDPHHVAELTSAGEFEVLMGWEPSPRPWLDLPDLTGTTVMVGAAQRAAVAEGRMRYVPMRLSAVPRYLQALTPDIAVVSGVRRGSGFAYRGTVGWGPALCESAAAVVVEVDETAVDLGAPAISGPIQAIVSSSDVQPAAPRSVSDDELIIGRYVASLIPVDATIQVGPGGVTTAIIDALEHPVSVYSGLVTDVVASLHERELLIGNVVAGYVWGGQPIAALAEAGRLELHRAEFTHNVGRIAAIPRMVTCNGALQVGLDGSVNVEQVGGRAVAGIGGHSDFCAGAAQSVGGVSIIALRSTTPKGRSTIVNRVEVVSTQRSDVDVVVTEHGVADLRGRDAAQCRAALVAVAAPEHRDELSSEF